MTIESSQFPHEPSEARRVVEDFVAFTILELLRPPLLWCQKTGKQGVMKSLAFPENQGPCFKILSTSSWASNFTMKNPFEQRYVSHFLAHVLKTH